MKIEIENLEKIYKLTNEQIKLQKQVKHKENQIAQSKSLQQLDIQDNEHRPNSWKSAIYRSLYDNNWYLDTWLPAQNKQ